MFKFKSIDVSKVPFKNLLIVCLAIVCITSVRQCSNKSLEVESKQGQWKFKYAMMVDSFKVETNKFGEQLAYQDQLLINEKEAKEMLKMENSSLKKLASSTKVKTNTVIKEVFIPFEKATSDAVERSFIEGDTSAYVPKIFRVNNEWYGVNGRVLDNGVILDSVYFNNTVTSNIGWKRDTWYKKKYAVVEVKNSNPYTNTVGMQNIIVTPPKKKFFQTTAFKIGVGAVGALYLRSKL